MSKTLTLPLLKKKTGELSQCSISYDAKSSYVINLQSEQLGHRQFEGPDFFECLCYLRKAFEEIGWLLLCNGSRIDAFPSGMSRQMGGGLKLYITKLGEHSRMEDIVVLFDIAPADTVGTVQEQLDYHKKWVASSKPRWVKS